jgi:type I restriction enzyme M protein
LADDTKKQLETQLWNIANTLRGKMGADEFRDYILGFIFYKYLSERIHLFADDILQHDGVTFAQIDETSAAGKTMLDALREESLGRLGYFLKPSQLFHRVAAKGAQATDNFILEDLAGILKHIEARTLGHDSEDDFEGLFEGIDLGSSKLGKTENQKNELIAKVLTHLDKIDFRLADTEAACWATPTNTSSASSPAARVRRPASFTPRSSSAPFWRKSSPPGKNPSRAPTSRPSAPASSCCAWPRR